MSSLYLDEVDTLDDVDIDDDDETELDVETLKKMKIFIEVSWDERLRGFLFSFFLLLDTLSNYYFSHKII